MKVIEVNLGIGMNMFFVEPLKIIIEDETNSENPKKRKKTVKPIKKEIKIEKE